MLVFVTSLKTTLPVKIIYKLLLIKNVFFYFFNLYRLFKFHRVLPSYLDLEESSLLISISSIHKTKTVRKSFSLSCRTSIICLGITLL